MKHRPVGLGIQGLADALVLLRIPFDSDEAKNFNAKVMETIYLASCTASNNMAKERCNMMKELVEWFNNNHYIPIRDFYEDNVFYHDEYINDLYHKLKPCKWEILNKNMESTTLGAYSSFDGSPFSKGIFQFDMWENTNLNYKEKWDKLREQVKIYGMRNSMLTALMPTASTSQILGNNECFEFFTNNIYSRKTQAGSFVLVNKYLVDDLIKVGLWSKEIKDSIIAMNGSIQALEIIPPEIRNIYKNLISLINYDYHIYNSSLPIWFYIRINLYLRITTTSQITGYFLGNRFHSV
jgi:ribonucleoside-diphosphate reductase alpha chain